MSEPPSPFPANEVVAALGLGPRGRSRRPWARGCLDWTARRPHVAGQLGAQVLEAFQHHRWLTGRPGSRAVRLTATGQQALAELESLSH